MEWIAQLPPTPSLHIDAHHAGAAVVLALIATHPPTQKTVHVRVHHAPLDWLQKRFGLSKKRKVILEQMTYPGCPWSKAA
jgi:hypothetical protein